MSQIVCDITVSADGFCAGPDQSQEHPFGRGGDRLHRWLFEGAEENTAEFAAQTAPRAYVMGRNMFGPVRGPWSQDWNGWWGDEPPYHAPVFVLTHHSREPLQLQGTSFTFVTDGIEAALDQARAADGDHDVAIAGGAATVNQYLTAGLIDELRLHIAPVVLGRGERVFDGVPDSLTLRPYSSRTTDLVTHLTYRLNG